MVQEIINDDFSDSIEIKGSLFINNSPHESYHNGRKDKKSLDGISVNAVSRAFIRSFVEKKDKTNVSHQIYFTIRATIDYRGFRAYDEGVARDNFGNGFTMTDIPGSDVSENWGIGGFAQILFGGGIQYVEFALRDHAINCADAVLRSYRQAVKFRITSRDNINFIFQVPYDHIIEQVAAVDRVISSR